MIFCNSMRMLLSLCQDIFMHLRFALKKVISPVGILVRIESQGLKRLACCPLTCISGPYVLFFKSRTDTLHDIDNGAGVRPYGEGTGQRSKWWQKKEENVVEWCWMQNNNKKTAGSCATMTWQFSPLLFIPGILKWLKETRLSSNIYFGLLFSLD